MPIEIVVALITLLGVITSIIISLIISTRQLKAESDKLRTEIRQTYTDALLESRIQSYPRLYKLLSDFDKVIRFDTLTQPIISELLESILKWDSEFAIFMSGATVNAYHVFRMRLNAAKHMTKDEFETEFASKEKHTELRRIANNVEVALKRDIGIYIVEFSDEDRKFETYRDVYVELQSRSKKR